MGRHGAQRKTANVCGYMYVAEGSCLCPAQHPNDAATTTVNSCLPIFISTMTIATRSARFVLHDCGIVDTHRRSVPGGGRIQSA